MTSRARGPSYERQESLQDPLNPQHELLIAAPTGSNGKVLRVWCKCMSEYKNAGRYFNFDHLKDTKTLEEAKQIYDNHLRVSTILVAVAKFHKKQEELDAKNKKFSSSRVS